MDKANLWGRAHSYIGDMECPVYAEEVCNRYRQGADKEGDVWYGCEFKVSTSVGNNGTKKFFIAARKRVDARS